MKTTHTSDERTPLLESGAALNEQTTLDGRGVTTNKRKSSFGEGTSSSEEKPPIISDPSADEQSLPEVPLEEVVQALFSAWQRNEPIEDSQKVTLEYLRMKDLYAMHLAWKSVTRGKRCSSEPHIIAEAVAEAIAKHLYPENFTSTYYLVDYTKKKCFIAANLLDEWVRIADGDELPARYVESIVVDADGQPVAVSEFGRRQIDLYDKVHDFILNPRLQVRLHSLLFIWPISILIIGSKYMDCPMGHHLSYLLMILGCIGVLALIGRLALMHLSSIDGFPFLWYWKWIGLKLIEFSFLVVFVVQAFHLFSTDPETEPDPKLCFKSFYRDALMLNYVSIALVSVYVIVYFIIFCVDQFNFWNWIFRNF